MSARTRTRACFACPACGGGDTLAVVRRLVLPGDRRSDEIALEILACGCGFKTLAVTEQLQTPRLSGAARKTGADERVGYRLPAAAVDLFTFLIAQCPNPAEEYCTCRAHAALNRRDLRDRWNVLHSFAPVAGFALAPAKGPPANAALSPAEPEFRYEALTWTRAGAGCTVTVAGRLWRIEAADPAAPPHEISIAGAMGFEFDPWPPFWHVLGAD